MPTKNPFLQELKDLGATDDQLLQLRNLQKELETDNTYQKIEKLNERLMGERVRPITLNYENALKIIKYNFHGNVTQIIDEYKNAKMLVDTGTTQEYERYLQQYAEELQDMGIYNATPDTLRNQTSGDVDYYFSLYKQYEATNNEHGMKLARQKIIELLGS